MSQECRNLRQLLRRAAIEFVAERPKRLSNDEGTITEDLKAGRAQR